MYHGDYRISQSGRFWWPLFDSNFYTVNVIFGWNHVYFIPEKFYIFFHFWESDDAKNFAIIFDGFDTRKKRFRLVSDFKWFAIRQHRYRWVEQKSTFSEGDLS